MLMHDKNIKRLVYILSVFIFGSCSGSSISESIGTNTKDSHILTYRLVEKDSLQVYYTFKKWSEQNWYRYIDYSKMYRLNNSEVSYFVTNIFYSPDSLKIIAWVVEKLPNVRTIETYNQESLESNKICPNSSDTVYNVSAIIGFRTSNCKIWNLYPLWLFSMSCANSLEMCVEAMRQYYFHDMKDNMEYVNYDYLNTNFGGSWDMADIPSASETNRGILKKYGYNLCDEGFWDRSLLWQIGARVPGLYNFQTSGNVTLNDIDYNLKVPYVVYPDTLKKKFCETD